MRDTCNFLDIASTSSARKEEHLGLRYQLSMERFLRRYQKSNYSIKWSFTYITNISKKKGTDTPKETLKEVERAIQCIDDQTIIACSQIIEKASIRPRLRIMAEVHPEGNPHSTFYPQITEGSFNLILKSTDDSKLLKDKLENRIAALNVFPIMHIRNGEHLVFQYNTKKTLFSFR